jgi:hypothetical protein
MRRFLLVFLLFGVLTPTAAQATVRVSRAELSGTRLRLEGTATPSRTITANGVNVGSSDSSGNFRAEKDPFAKPGDCKVSVNDGSSTPTTATLSGCTVSSTPTPTPTPTPTTAPKLSSVTVSPTEVLGGASATGTVTLTSAAPSGGLVVPLTSDNTNAATIPASVTVPAGSTRATFPVTTKVVPNPQSALLIGTAGGVTTYAIITVFTASQFSSGSVAILPGGGGSGFITSSPAGINCTITRGNGSGACTAFFPVGTIVRLDARAASDSRFQGWRGLPGCGDPSRITIARGITITCQPGFSLR